MGKKGGSGSRKVNPGEIMKKDTNRPQPTRQQVRPNDPPPSRPPTKGRGE